MILKLISIFIIIILSMLVTFGQVNYEEKLVPQYTLPSLVESNSGKIITTSDEWESIRKAEILDQFTHHMYGEFNSQGIQTSFQISQYPTNPHLQTPHICQQVDITLTNGTINLKLALLLYIPKTTADKKPVFLGLNFFGNHTIQEDPNILVTNSWVANNEGFNIANNTATVASRGVRQSRWPVDDILKRGYALATMYYGDIDPDFDDGFENGIHRLIKDTDKSKLTAISAWAYGLSKAMDYFESSEHIDAKRVAVIGHSRLGKAALWAGAIDKRFAMVISNNSGCGGAALSKRRYGETVEIINTNFPHWFNDKFKAYNANEAELEFDQHMLLSLIAPRPLYVASADEDKWADPYGEYLSLYYAAEIFNLYGIDCSFIKEKPKANSPVIIGKLGYHIRSGKHDLTLYDWQQYLNFADIHLKE